MAENKAKTKGRVTSRAINSQSVRASGPSKAIAKIRFVATLHRPAGGVKGDDWSFLTLPMEASAKLPSRGMTSVEGTFNGADFQATLEPDGKGGHWLKVERQLREAACAEVGDEIALEIAPAAVEPEPRIPTELRKALAAAEAKARAAWSDITPVARRDWIQWIESAKREETRLKRIESACDMLAKGKRRPCCFDRSGMYDKSISCPVAEETMSDAKRQKRTS
jgi:hypothetical protein